MNGVWSEASISHRDTCTRERDRFDSITKVLAYRLRSSLLMLPSNYSLSYFAPVILLPCYVKAQVEWLNLQRLGSQVVPLCMCPFVRSFLYKDASFKIFWFAEKLTLGRPRSKFATKSKAEKVSTRLIQCRHI